MFSEDLYNLRNYLLANKSAIGGGSEHSSSRSFSPAWETTCFNLSFAALLIERKLKNIHILYSDTGKQMPRGV